ncbi:rna-directed dna polymerase from mobile element jockey-like [Willisornis vidua]|uniref:Rna-directed dna polymerase from mobile element jockey-like n=1 Tax=Willisornis vidua TaxID=1566151 RepID=A0ABQ9CLE3_9PASS|nr:rna-directed dna polymerase from mobile element jockey-like [Willisornis vidua]
MPWSSSWATGLTPAYGEKPSDLSEDEKNVKKEIFPSFSVTLKQLFIQSPAPGQPSSSDSLGEKIRGSKAQLELKLVSTLGDNKKSFSKYVSSKRQSRNHIDPLLDEDDLLTNRNTDKAEIFNAFFTLVFKTKDGLYGSQNSQLEDHECENNELPVNPDLVRDLLLQLDLCNFMGPDRIHPRVLKELANVIVYDF